MDYQDRQAYLTDIEAPFAWSLSGGGGAGVRIIDIEKAWRLMHEDLPAPFFQDPNAPGETQDHGTMVLGVMAGYDTGFGVRGIASAAQYGVVSTVRPSGQYSVADAVNVGAGLLDAFDVLLLEVQQKGPPSGQRPNPICGSNTDSFEYIPVEYWLAEFDAIQTATSRGLNVVEAAGNGHVNLDHANYGGLFNRAYRDSGAIMVGARARACQCKTCFSNYGSRLDVCAWGEQVFTTGGGDVRVRGAEGDPRQWYTSGFSGTSSASAIVAGAVASLVGIQKHNLTKGAALHGVHRLNPVELRTLLQVTGRPLSHPETGWIGPTVNLRNAFDRWSRGLIPIPGSGGSGTP
jgi:subtilisin family serine protease